MKRQNLSKGMFTGVRTWKGLLRPVGDNKMNLKRKQHNLFYLIQTV